MSVEPAEKTATVAATTTPTSTAENIKEAANVEKIDKTQQAKELYSQGSRNYLIKNYAEAADDLSRVCALYAEVYGDVADELGMPYLLYAKSLIALSLDENKVIDVPDEEALNEDDEDDEDDDEEEDDEQQTEAEAGKSAAEKIVDNKEAQTNGTVKHDSEATPVTIVNGLAEATTVKPTEATEEADSTADGAVKAANSTETVEAQVSSTVATATTSELVLDDEKPSTSNGTKNAADGECVNAEDEEAASNLQLAWEILETAAKIFTRQGTAGYANLAEVQTELGNIQFENCILEAARADYEKALKIYNELENQNYRRAKAEIHYKIGLTYLMEQMNNEGATSLKNACQLIQGEIDEIKAKAELSEKDKNTTQDLEETKQEIEAKIVEIEEMKTQQIADVRAALDSYIKPMMSQNANDAAAPSSSTAATSIAGKNVTTTDTKPKDISHLIKRKAPAERTSDTEAAESPAKRPAI